MEAYIRFFAGVTPQSTDMLLKAIDTKITQGATKIHLIISSPGGSVFHGLSLYNYLKGIPIPVHTYNFGSVDSIGVVVFCAGQRRFSVPHARFLMHGVSFNFQAGGQADEKQLIEYLKGLQIDQNNIAKVIADTCGYEAYKVLADMHNRTTLNPEESVAYGLVHTISSQLVPNKAQVVVINEVQPGQTPVIQEVIFNG
ncbi:MAG: ATP-dependent Clp protease proteolytic subunit [Saprospiraceae bacterium]|nr:ATP-dependent Clp protease proteolytic subunit [Saprospiraceae bacterium]